MRAVSDDFARALAQPATTLATAWRLVRRDGVAMGFTDHDEDLRFAGTAFSARSGWTAGEAEAELGLSPGSAGAEGALSAEAIREEEVAAGLFDGARVEVFRVDWQAPEARHLMLDAYELGEVTRGGGAFRAELRGLAARLDRVHGRRWRRRCDAALGDRRCGVDLSVAGRRLTVRVLRGEGGAPVLRVDGLIEAAEFAHGRLRLADGRELAVRALMPGAAEGEWRAVCVDEVPAGIAEGAAAELRIGCDRSFATCRDRFRNGANFRGFPHLPGADAALRVAKSDALHDGSPLVP